MRLQPLTLQEAEHLSLQTASAGAAKRKQIELDVVFEALEKRKQMGALVELLPGS